MLKLLLGIVLELFVAVALAGLILALAIPLLHRNDLAGTNDAASGVVIIGVLAGAIAVALFRPGSAIQRHLRR